MGLYNNRGRIGRLTVWLAGAFLLLGCMGATPMGTDTDDSPINGDENDPEKAYDEGLRLAAAAYDGVDLLIMVDNSGSMMEEQQILAEQFFPLINHLTQPIQGDPSWSFPRVENLNVALVTSDMGLQYGDNGDTSLSPWGVPTCDVKDHGDNGAFMPINDSVTEMSIPDDFIECEPYGNQCPDGFECADDGFCDSSDDTNLVACTDDGSDLFATSASVPNSDIAAQTACLALQGTRGCGFEQQLEAMLRGAETHPSFIEDNHVLAVVVVSDEEDCSIEDPALFSTPEWLSAVEQNIACNANATNESYLFDPARYHDRLKALKGGRDDAVVFSAIVGVPNTEESPCEGTGTELAAAECLDLTEMEIVPQEFVDPPTGSQYVHFRPACTRTNSETGMDMTVARPGRRFVKVAEDFGDDGFVQSICNEDWGPGLESVGDAIAQKLTQPCFPTAAPWTEAATDDCPECGTVSETCDLFIEYAGTADELEDFECPSDLAADLSDDEQDELLAKTITETDGDNKTVYCAIPKLPAPLACDDAADQFEDIAEMTGWTYCENGGVCEQRINATDPLRTLAAGHFFAYRCKTIVK